MVSKTKISNEALVLWDAQSGMIVDRMHDLPQVRLEKIRKITKIVLVVV